MPKKKKGEVVQSLIEQFEQQAAEGKPITQSDLIEAGEKQGISEKEQDMLFEWMNNHPEYVTDDKEIIAMINNEKKKKKDSGNGHAKIDIVQQYLDEIGDYPAITLEEEQELAKRAEEGDKDAKEELIMRNLKLVVFFAKKYVGKGIAIEDLIQEGNLGLMHAVEKFDYRKGFRLSTYAAWWITQHMMRAIGNNSRAIRVPIHIHDLQIKLNKKKRELTQELGQVPTIEELASATGLSEERILEVERAAKSTVSLEDEAGDDDRGTTIGDYVKDNDAIDPVEYAADNILREILDNGICKLDETDRSIIHMRYGLNGQETFSLQEIGVKKHLTRERIRQLESRALKRLNFILIGKRYPF